MKTSARRPKSARKARSASKAALGRYLAAGLGATGLASMECEAAIVNLDITNIGGQDISGVNAGILPGDYQLYKSVSDPFPTTPNQFYVSNGHTWGAGPMTGLIGGQNTSFATAGSYGTPRIFSEGQLVDGSPSNNFGTNNIYQSAFQGDATYPGGVGPFSVPSITGPGNYMGFRSGQPGNYIYGYFEVTWDQTSSEFQILSGAYESTLNTPIAVPEPSAIALTGIGALALGAGAIRRSRKARKVAA